MHALPNPRVALLSQQRPEPGRVADDAAEVESPGLPHFLGLELDTVAINTRLSAYLRVQLQRLMKALQSISGRLHFARRGPLGLGRGHGQTELGTQSQRRR